MKTSAFLYLSSFLIFNFFPDLSFSQNCHFSKGVEIKILERYHDVTLDFTKEPSHYKIGESYGCSILNAVPNYRQLVDSYLKSVIETPLLYYILIKRANAMKINLPKQYLEEIQGLSSSLADTNQDILGDGKLSPNEMLMVSLLADIGRASQCTLFSVFGPKSSTGKNLIARALDWRAGNKRQITHIQALIRIKYPQITLYSVGYLGFTGILTGITSKKNFAAILDSPDGAASPFFWDKINSYPLDLRQALERNYSIDQTAVFMSQKKYSYNHLIFLANDSESIVLENNLNKKREIRKSHSKLNPGIEWSEKNAIAAVNSFLLKGNFDNHTSLTLNTKRFNIIRKKLAHNPMPWDMKILKELFSSYQGKKPGSLGDGDIFNRRTQQIILYDPSSNSLQLFFTPIKGQPLKPDFISINLEE